MTKSKHKHLRHLIDLAVAAGRKRQSKQTNFLHYSPKALPGDPHDAIPIQENLLFALALLRSHTAESATEARELLNRLLPFQLPDGSFPLYLHEYPLCSDRYRGASLLPPLWMMLLHFRPIIRTTPLEQSTQRLLASTIAIIDQHGAPWHLLMKAAASAAALGKLYQNHSWTDWGKTHFERALTLALEQKQDQPWKELPPTLLGDILLSLQMCDRPHIRDEIIALGPIPPFEQWGYEPAVTFYDLYCYCSPLPLRNSSLDHPIYLQGALIEHTERTDHLTEHPRYAYCVEQSKETIHRVLWRSKNRLHSFICADETTFYFDRNPDTEITVQGMPATTFQLGDRIQIKQKKMTITMQIVLESGQEETTRYTGHIHPGNRPGQRLAKGTLRFEAYDWKIFLRAVDTAFPCRLRTNLQIEAT